MLPEIESHQVIGLYYLFSIEAFAPWGLQVGRIFNRCILRAPSGHNPTASDTVSMHKQPFQIKHSHIRVQLCPYRA